MAAHQCEVIKNTLGPQVLASFLKAIGFIIPLMDSMYANYYTKEVMVVLIREFQTPDEEMKKIVLKVVKQCVGTEGTPPPLATSLPKINAAPLGPLFTPLV